MTLTESTLHQRYAYMNCNTMYFQVWYDECIRWVYDVTLLRYSVAFNFVNYGVTLDSHQCYSSRIA